MADEYIEREKLKNTVNGWLKDDTGYFTDDERNSMLIFLSVIENAPTADVVEVVRCKDCKHWGGVTFGYICRRFSGTTLRNETRETDYCSFGAKMDGKGEGE